MVPAEMGMEDELEMPCGWRKGIPGRGDSKCKSVQTRAVQSCHPAECLVGAEAGEAREVAGGQT